MINLIIYLESKKASLWTEVGICNRYIDRNINKEQWQIEKDKKLKEIEEVENEIKELQEKQQ